MTTRGHHGILLGSGAAPAVTWNPADRDAAIILSNGNLTMASSLGGWRTGRATVSKSSGKWYDEAIMAGQSGTLSDIFGVCTGTYSLTTFIGSGGGGWGIQGAGAAGQIRTFLAGSNADHAGLITTGQRAKIAIDIDAGNGWMAKVGAAWIGGGDPAAGTSPTFTFTPGTTLFFAGSAFSGTSGTITRVAGSYTDTVPSGFTGIG